MFQYRTFAGHTELGIAEPAVIGIGVCGVFLSSFKCVQAFHMQCLIRVHIFNAGCTQGPCRGWQHANNVLWLGKRLVK